MLFLIIFWSYLFFISLSLGNAILITFKAKMQRIGDHAIVAIWTGVVCLGIILLTVSLFTALAPSVGWIVSCVALATVFLPATRQMIIDLWQQSSVNFFVSVFILLIAVAGHSVQIVSWGDTGLYHFGIIQWLSQFGTPYGIALIHERFGFIPSWFSLSAPLNHGFLTTRMVAATGGFVLFLAVLHFTVSLRRIFQLRSHPADWFFVACLPMTIAIPLLRKMFVSPSHDLPIYMLTILIAWLFLLLPNGQRPIPAQGGLKSVFDENLIPVILASGALTIKLSAIPLLAVSLLFYWQRKMFRIKPILVALSLSLIVLTPVVFAGIKTSGCPLFPFPLCFNLPWSLGVEGASAYKDVLESDTRWWTSTPPSNASAWQWIKMWPQRDFSNKVASVYLFLAIVSLFVLFRRKLNRQIIGMNWVVLLGIAGTGFVLFTVPYPRLGWGYFTIIPALSILSLYRQEPTIWQPLPVHDWVISLAIGAVVLVTILFRVGFERNIHRSIEAGNLKIADGNLLLLPPKMLSVQIANYEGRPRWYDRYELSNLELTSYQVNDINYVVPEIEGICWATPIPCAPRVLTGIQLKFPGQGMGGGFVKTKGNQ